VDLTERGDGATRHPWEVQRFRAFRRVLQDHDALRCERVLDVGSGDGWFSDALAASLPGGAAVTCWDINYAEHDLEGGQPGTTRTSDRPTATFDLILALDVIEHVEDPVAFIAESLMPLGVSGTNVLVSVPAYQRLFGAHDEVLGHFRRYERRELLDQLEPWIDVVEHGSLFASLLVPRAAAVMLERRSERFASRPHGIGGWSGGRISSAVIGGVLGLDARLGRALGQVGVRLPGLSHWAYGVVR
jgi:SAM-dependent methyltransferase